METLTPKDEALAVHLASGLRYGDAAKKVGVSSQTVWRRMADPRFRGRVDAIRSAAAGQVYNRLVSLLDDAVASLHAVALTAHQPADRVRAAVALLDHHLKLHERAEVEERLRRLEGAGGDAAGEAGQAGTD